MQSSSVEGNGQIVIEFNAGTDMQSALSNVETAVGQVTTLPEDSETPEIRRLVRYDTISRIVISGPYPEASLKEIAKRWLVVVRSATIGVFTGILPGAGGSVANILAYDQAKKASKEPEKFGSGTSEGIIAPESSNNAVEGGALITLIGLGIPGDVTAAVMLGALLIHDVVPSPTFISEEPVLVYSIFTAFFIATFMMIFLQSFMLRMFVMVTRIRMYMLACVILGFCGIGVFALHNVTFDLWSLLWFGILGFIMRQFGFPLAPMILGVVLGNIAELNLARALAITSDLTPFLTRPWSLFFLIIALFSAVFPVFQQHRGRKKWTLFYMPFACVAASVPLYMMGGMPRPIIATIVVVFGAWTLFKRWKSGWALEETLAQERAYTEG